MIKESAMTTTRRAAAACSTLVAAIAVAACGSSGNGNAGSSPGGKLVTVYSSQPLQGATNAEATDVINGEKLALAQHGSRAGDCRVKYVSMDDSTAAAG